jgi:branched-subunit amino acid aminotransferase/4-amino-4-deoxychorismate lyase
MQSVLELCWYNGHLMEVTELRIAEASFSAFFYGLNVFTTLRVYGGNLDQGQTQWQAHGDRISHSLQTFGWSEPDWAQIRQGCLTLLPHYPILRIAIFPDGRELITGRPLPSHLDQEQTQGVIAWLAEDPLFRRTLPTHKTGNYLSNWLALQQAQTLGARDAILTNAEGHWLETSTGNLWGWKAGQWWTPPLSAGILPGITRAYLINGLQAGGQAVVEQPWTPTLVPQFEALAYVNCVVECLPIHTVLMGNTTLEYDPNHDGFKQFRELFA